MADAARDNIARLIGDCMVLLEHLTGATDARLDWCFDETRARTAGTPPTRIAAPPATVATKAEFLERLTALEGRLGDAQATFAPGEVAFLIGARDFLSTLARPVTIDTIRITREYVRPGHLLRDAWRWIAPPANAPKPLKSEHFGRRLAASVMLWRGVALALVVLTVWVSIYALVGRGLVVEVRTLDQQFAALSADLAKAEVNDASVFLSAGLAGNSETSRGPQWLHYCDMRVDGPTRSFVTRQHQQLCDRYEGYNAKFLLLFANLDRWRDQWPGNWTPGLERPAPAPKAREAAEKADVTGIADAPANGGAKPRSSTAVLNDVQQHRLALTNAEVVLRAIAEYLLPCLYAMLGALAASLRHIAHRVENVTLDYADGGVVTRTLVLGVLFGAVIGLFASQLAPIADGDSAAASLTPAALSLLAGYSVAQVFAFFDSLAQRVFGPRPEPADAAR